MKQFSAKICSNQKISDNFFQMEFLWELNTPPPLAGQFLTIRVTDDAIPLLRRPFAFSGFNHKKNEASIIYQKRGKGTEVLAAREPGENIDIIGPLGKPFPLPSKQQKAFMVAGGIGLGPILFLVSTTRAQNIDTHFIFGSRDSTVIPQKVFFTALNPEICTDDGSAGFAGNVGDYLNSISDSITPSSVLYCCGPYPMLRACHSFAGMRNIPCWVSVEQIMACGVGACMGCVVKVKKSPGYARACKEGPVFASNEMIWE
jgi:dihydroorotate dehydrogenase electron transfer subunit